MSEEADTVAPAQAMLDETTETRHHRRGAVHIDLALCKACDICVALCPRGVLDAVPGKAPAIVRPDECNGCRNCELHCPDFAVRVECDVAPGDSSDGGVA